MPAENQDRYAIRITDRGAIAAVTQTIDTLIHLHAVLQNHRITTIPSLIRQLRSQLRKFLRWLDRVPDGTLLQRGITRQQVNSIRQGAKMVLRWKMVPSAKEYATWDRHAKKLLTLEQQKESVAQQRIGVLPDTSFLASYLSGSEPSSAHDAVKKTYQDVHYVTDKPASYVNFINCFERRKRSISDVQAIATPAAEGVLKNH